MNINADIMASRKEMSRHVLQSESWSVRKDVKNNFSVCTIMIPFTQREKAGRSSFEENNELRGCFYTVCSLIYLSYLPHNPSIIIPQ